MPDQDMSLREELEAASKAQEEIVEEVVEDVVEDVAEEAQPDEEEVKEPEDPPEVKEDASEDDSEEELEASDEDEEEIPPPPQSLKGDIKERWNEISPELREEFIRLESTQAKGMQKVAEDANFGKELKAELQPYEAMIRSEGGTPATAVRSLLNTAYQLRTGSPAQKVKLFNQLAQQYGVDVKSLSQEQPKLDPNYEYLANEFNQFKQDLTQQQTQQQQAQNEQAMQVIERFSQDPENKHFEDVQDHIFGILQSGMVDPSLPMEEKLKTAYDTACWANPEIRKQILRQQEKAKEAERKKAEKAEVNAKKTAGASVKGSPSKSSSGKLSEDMPLRDMLEAQINGTAQRI